MFLRQYIPYINIVVVVGCSRLYNWSIVITCIRHYFSLFLSVWGRVGLLVSSGWTKYTVWCRGDQNIKAFLLYCERRHAAQKPCKILNCNYGLKWGLNFNSHIIILFNFFYYFFFIIFLVYRLICIFFIFIYHLFYRDHK